jgi:predicted RNA binding protein YcfA (HicA-like mRNA interferase family)
MNRKKFLRRLLQSQTNARFSEVTGLAEALGFRLQRISGSHHIFLHSTCPAQLNLQEVNGQAKPYQVRQLLKLVEQYDLRLVEE